MPDTTPDPAADSTADGAQAPAEAGADTPAAASPQKPRLPGWLARVNPKIAAAAVGMLVFGGAGYAIGNHAPAATTSGDQATFAPGARNNASGANKLADEALSARPGGYYSNVLTADSPSDWPTIAEGATRAGYAASTDEAARVIFTDRLLVALGLPATPKADGSVEWSECADGICRSVGVMADAEGSFNASVGSWPGSCVDAVPGSMGMVEPKGAPQALPAETVIAPAPAVTASEGDRNGSSGSRGASIEPMPAMSCSSPEPAPTVDAATQMAESWLGLLGLTKSNSDVVAMRDAGSYVTNAYIYQVIDGQRSRLMATLTYAGGPQLISLYGSFAKLQKVADYRIISAADAVKRTHDAQWAGAAQQVWDMTTPIAMDIGIANPVSPTMAPLQTDKLTGRIDDVVVTNPVPSLMQMFDVNGNSVWVPAYRVTDKATGKTKWDVAAIEGTYFSG